MSIARYIVALIVVIAVPPGYLLWYVIHPLVHFWRRLGVRWTYWILLPPVLVLMLLAVLVRDTLLGRDLGTHFVLLAPAALCLGVGVTIAARRKKYLKFGILAGAPELSENDKGTLLTEGIYGVIRHPRYVETVFIVFAYALFANYVGSYIVAVSSVPAIYLIVLMEEHELRERFGEEYEEYCREVPRFVPRRSRAV
jgi:protein-S-isoprenylcysteine O-methyltransferase Ste14